MSEQLSINFTDELIGAATNATSDDMTDDTVNYEALDYQLADLMQKQNAGSNSTLEYCTLELSKHSREGQIFIQCDSQQQKELLATKVVGKAGDYKPLILDNDYLFLNRYFSYQQQLARNIQSRLNPIEENESDEQWASSRLDYYFKSDLNKAETNWQKVAAEHALKCDFLVLSGGPGTGKTTTICRILALLIEQYLKDENKEKDTNNIRILLAAPTGKAAIRMLDSLREAQQKLNLSNEVIQAMPAQASTLHKLLGYQANRVQFKHNKNQTLNADIVLVDEASMIDIALMSKLVDAVPANAKLILIGDQDQLSSVETGSVFADICKGLINTPNMISLRKNWRFSKDSGIGQLAIAANNSDSQQVLAILEDASQADCQLVSPELIGRNQVPSIIIDPWRNYFKALKNPESSIKEIFEAFNHYRILCALRLGLNGSRIMSSRIEAELIKQGLLQVQAYQNNSNKTWYHGRPVMITQNSYSKGLFNGDTGITLIKDGKAKVYFPNEQKNTFKSLAPIRLAAHETAWAMTIHKSQGSEFNEVALILPHEVMPLLTKQLIYTGITRAKQKVTIIADESIVTAGVKTRMAQATQIEKSISI